MRTTIVFIMTVLVFIMIVLVYSAGAAFMITRDYPAATACFAQAIFLHLFLGEREL